MAFINVESRGIDYRVILGDHSQIVPASQMPDLADGLLLEDVATDPILLLAFTANRFHPVHTGRDDHYKDLLDHCRAHKVPVIMAEPIYSYHGALTMRKREPDSPEKEYIAKQAYVFLSMMAETPRELLAHSEAFEEFKKFADLVLEQFGREKHQFRNLIMAHRAEVFARRLAILGVSRPRLALACGSAHIGVIRALEIDFERRAEMIRRNSLFEESLSPTERESIYYAAYDNSDQQWHVRSLEDPELRLNPPQNDILPV
jgi:hypothetical protein